MRISAIFVWENVNEVPTHTLHPNPRAITTKSSLFESLRPVLQLIHSLWGLLCRRRVFGPGSHAHRFVYISNKPRVCCSLPSLLGDSNQFLKTALSSSPELSDDEVILRAGRALSPMTLVSSDTKYICRHSCRVIVNSSRLDNGTN